MMEAESELVAGFNVEYSGLKFGMFYVAEFLHAFTNSVLFSVLFLGGWQGPGADVYPWLGFLYTDAEDKRRFLCHAADACRPAAFPN